jgi:hypothetical protein
MSDIYKEFEVDFLRTRYAGPTAAEMKMAQEITRLRARVAALWEALGLLTTLAPRIEIDTSDPMKMARQIEATVRACVYGSSASREALDKRDAEIERLRAEVQEQARLLGMGISIEREAKLRARVEVLERVREAVLPHLFTPSMETGIALLKAVQEAKP